MTLSVSLQNMLRACLCMWVISKCLKEEAFPEAHRVSVSSHAQVLWVTEERLSCWMSKARMHRTSPGPADLRLLVCICSGFFGYRDKHSAVVAYALSRSLSSSSDTYWVRGQPWLHEVLSQNIKMSVSLFINPIAEGLLKTSGYDILGLLIVWVL